MSLSKDSETERLNPGIWKVTSVAVLGSFLAQIDATVVNVSLSSLAVELHSSLSAIQWVTSGYLLALALMLPLNGWMVDRIGAKALYLWCFTAFTLSSALCGMAWSANSLIAFRILQGMSGGLLAPMAQMMMARAAGKHMARVLGLAALPIMLAPILGPVIAGAILQYASWRWLFLINLPVGALALVLAVLFLPGDREEIRPRDFDLIGFALLSPGLVLFLYGSEHLGERTGLMILLFSLVLLAVFIRTATRRRQVPDRSSTVQGEGLLGFCHDAVHVEWSLVRGSDVDSDLSDPRLWPFTQHDGLAACASWPGDDVHLPVDGNLDQALWHSQCICRRRASGIRWHVAISLPGKSRTGSCCTRVRALYPRRWSKRHRYSFNISGVCVR